MLRKKLTIEQRGDITWVKNPTPPTIWQLSVCKLMAGAETQR